jgi:hypothetical protein
MASGVTWLGLQFLGQPEQAVGLAAHRRGHHHHLVAGAHPFGDALATLRMRSVEPIEVPPYL